MTDRLAAIKALYYSTSKATITRDFDRAIDLLKSMESEDERERATVYMHGLAELKNQWQVRGTKNEERETKNRTAK
jgi:hypothetical protein